jgi:exodeoxyribonuclease VII large subunit
MTITLKQLGDIIKYKLPTDKFTIKGEIRQPKISSGHMYLILKDDTFMINCIVWKTKLNESIKSIKDGDLVNIKGSLDYYAPRGEIKLIVNSLEKNNTIGDLYKIFETMKTEFKKNGYFDKKIKLPLCIKNILVLSSMNGAAIHDFNYALNNNKSLITSTTIDVQVQGSECPKQIIEYLKNNDMSKYDIIVITRGGGSMEDLWGFNDMTLIETIYGRNYPVLSAIGHMVDTTLLDYVADVSAPTPSLAAQYIIDYNKKYIDELKSIKNNIYQKLINNINDNLLKLNKLSNIKNDFIDNIKNKTLNLKNNIKFNIKNNLIKLDMILSKYDNIILYKDNIKLEYDNFNNIITNNQPFILVWKDKIIKINNYELI